MPTNPFKPTLTRTPAGMDACALWRMFLPHMNSVNSKFLFTTGLIPMDTIAEGDVGVVQRMLTEKNVNYLKGAWQHNIAVIYDLDDDLWNLPKYNPSKHLFDKHKHGFEACAEWAGAITVSTEALRKAVSKQWGHLMNVNTGKPIPIITIENYIDLKLFHPTPLPRKRDTVRIGWGGSNTHSGDLAIVFEMLPQLLTEFSNVELEFVGMEAPYKIKGHPRVRQRQWCHISEYWNRLATWDWDIFLAPLDDNKFNRSKSSIKMQEAAACHKPCLATNIENYTRFANALGDPLNYLLCTSRYDWLDKLRELIRNEALRKELGEAMYTNAKDNFNIEKEVYRWDEAGLRALETLSIM